MTLIAKTLSKQTIEEIRGSENPVIIFGAGIVGEVLFHACVNAGIRVECFCDNNINKTKTTKCNINVVHTLNLKAKYKDAVFLISAADIKDVAEQLHVLGYSKWYAGGPLLSKFDLSQHQFSAPIDFVEYAVGTCLLCHDSYLTPDKLFVRSVDIVITERCSLKCRDCSNLMQYYKKPEDSSVEELLRAIDSFCTIIDKVNEFRVIGGEPFLNRGIHLILKRLIDEPKVKNIVIYTNGTIVPKDEQIECLRNDKILILITDYGALSRKLNSLTEIFLRNNIVFYKQKAQGWTDCAGLKRHFRSFEQQKRIFTNCCAKNTITLSKGKLYRCPFSANAARLSAVPNNKSDYIDLFQEPLDAAGIRETKSKVRGYLLYKNYLETCDYCNGRSFGAIEIQPAIQTREPLEYEQCRSA